MTLRHSYAWWFGWPATALYAITVNPICGVLILLAGAWITMRAK